MCACKSAGQPVDASAGAHASPCGVAAVVLAHHMLESMKDLARSAAPSGGAQQQDGEALAAILAASCIELVQKLLDAAQAEEAVLPSGVLVGKPPASGDFLAELSCLRCAAYAISATFMASYTVSGAHCSVPGKPVWPPRLLVAQLLHAAVAVAPPGIVAAVRSGALRAWLQIALGTQMEVQMQVCHHALHV